MSSAARILAVVPFQGCGKVRMTRARHCRKKLIVRGMRIGILKSHSQRRTRRMALVNAAHDLGEIGLDARSRTLRTALPPEDILLEIRLRQFQPSRNSVHDHTYELPVGLTENAYSEFPTYRIHIIQQYFFIQRITNISPKYPFTERLPIVESSAITCKSAT